MQSGFRKANIDYSRVDNFFYATGHEIAPQLLVARREVSPAKLCSRTTERNFPSPLSAHESAVRKG